MVNFYLGEIKVGRLTADDVPKLWVKKVKAKLEELSVQEPKPEEIQK